ncbi:MAG TPA: glycosyltransferase family 4 protein [Candidatus Methylacidiphilales bacterium]
MSSRRLHVLQIFNRYLQYGGEEGSITRIGDALQKIHDIDYFFYSTSQLGTDSFWTKLQVPWKSFRNPAVANGLTRLQQANHYNLWQIHNIFPAMSPVVYELALKWKIPIIHYLHNYRFACVNGFFLNHGKPCQRCLSGNFWPAFQTACWHESRLYSGWMGIITHYIRTLPLFEQVFRWVAISEAQKQEHVRMGIPAERIRVIHHFLDATEPVMAPVTTPTAIFVGRLSPEKGVDQLLDAWKLVAGGNRRLLIMGEGPELHRLEAKAASLPGVKFLGFVKGPDQRRYWQEASFSVMPSIWLEPFGMSVLESWAKGRPVVGHDIGALPELIEDGVDGTLSAPGRVEELARKLEWMFSNPERAVNMGLAGRRKLEERFSQARWLKEIAAIYDELVI